MKHQLEVLKNEARSSITLLAKIRLKKNDYCLQLDGINCPLLLDVTRLLYLKPLQRSGYCNTRHDLTNCTFPDAERNKGIKVKVFVHLCSNTVYHIRMLSTFSVEHCSFWLLMV